MPEPNLDAHVFLRITRPVGTFTIDNRNEDQVDLNPNDVILGRSASSARLVTTAGTTDRFCAGVPTGTARSRSSSSRTRRSCCDPATRVYINRQRRRRRDH